MRISTVTIFDQNVTNMNRQQAEFMKVGTQMSTGRRVVNISDDPQAASRAVTVSQSKAVNQQFMDARVGVRNSLSQTESVMNSVNDALTRGKTLLVQAANGTLSDGDRSAVASELKGVYEALIGQANTTDGNGRFIFGGYQDDTPPFSRNPDGTVNYVPPDDMGSREQKVDNERLMQAGNSGHEVFRSAHSGAPHYATAGDANGGTLEFGRVEPQDPTAADFNSPFRIEFSENGGDFTYSIFDSETNTEVVSDVAYNPDSGASVSFRGLVVPLQGTPEDGDEISVGRPNDLNTDIFKTFESAIAALESSVETPEQLAALRNTINVSMREIDNTMDNVLTVRASVGARLNELDSLDMVASNRGLAYEQTLSDLVDLDYVQAASDYSLRMVGLQAAQRAFVDINSMSLFDYLR